MSGATDEVQQLVSAGRSAQAVDRLISAAESGDRDALFMLAGWRISGQVIARDTAAARQLMGMAAEAGHPTATQLYSYFLANGTGGPADWARGREVLERISNQPAISEQLVMLDRMAVGEDGGPSRLPELIELSREPAVF